MKIYDVDGNLMEQEPDLSLGYLEMSRRFVAHHDAVEAVPAEIGYETMPGTEEFDGGLQREVVLKPAIPAKEAWDEYEDVQIYHPYTEEELEERNKPTLEERMDAMEGALLEMILNKE